MKFLLNLLFVSLFSVACFANSDSEATASSEGFDAQAVLDNYLIDGTLTGQEGYTAEQKTYQKGAYVYTERTWENGDESLNVITYNRQIKKFQEWGFYPWGTFYVQGEWNEDRQTMFYHSDNGEPTAKMTFNEDKTVSLEMLNLNNGDFFIWKAEIVPSK